MSHLCTTAIFPTIRHKRKILDIRLNIKDSRLVGVTRFELATTRPPELNFTFSNKFNELYSSGFHTLSKSCSLPLSGVVAISRVPLVFHTPSDQTRQQRNAEFLHNTIKLQCYLRRIMNLHKLPFIGRITKRHNFSLQHQDVVK